MSDLSIRVRLDDTGLDAQLKGVSKKFASVATAFAAVAVPVGVAAAVAQTIDGLAALGEEAIKSAGALYDQSRQLGVTAEALQEYRLVANAAGVGAEQFDKALAILNRTVGNSALGKGDFEKTLQSVGLSLKDHEGSVKSVSAVYEDLSDKIRDGSLSQAQSVALASAAFGRDGGKMVEVLRQTAEQQQAVIDKARAYGVILSDDLVSRMDEYGDELELVQQGTKALSIQTESLLAPLALKWAKVKEEIAGTTAEFAVAIGLTKEDTQLQARELAQIKSKLEYARKVAEQRGVADPGADPHIQFLESEAARLTAQIDAARKAAQAALPKPGANSGSGIDVDTDDEQSTRIRAAKEAAEYEMRLVTAVYDEKERVFAEELQQEQDWATVMADEKERVYTDELKQLQDWNNVLQEERDRAAQMDLDQYIQKEGLLTQVAKDGAEQRKRFTEMASGMQVKTVLDDLARITAGVAQNSRKMFELNKAAGIGQAIINTYVGITEALKAYPPPISLAMAGVQAAAGFAQVNAIKSATFSGGGKGTTPSAAGSSPVVNDTPTSGGAGGGGTQRLIVEGIAQESMFSGGAVRDLARRLLEFQRDGGEVILR